MDFEMDSDLDDIPEVEIEQPTAMPYLYEPIRPVNSPDDHRSDSDRSDSNNSASSDNEEELDDPIPDVAEWCVCNNCMNMPTHRECKCCITTNVVDAKVEADNLHCITEHEGFIVNCLNIHVLETSYYDYVLYTGPLEEDQLIHELYRYLAYRRFTRWVYGLLGKGTRKVIPSCAVKAIRDRFPSEEYCGFQYPQ